MSHTDLTPSSVLRISGNQLCIAEVVAVSRRRWAVELVPQDEVPVKMDSSVKAVNEAIAAGHKIYGVTTGFGGMVDELVSADKAAESQRNLLFFLAAGAGPMIDARHVRSAMLLRANMLLRGCSGVSLDIVQRLVAFINANAMPRVRQLGSIGASGDLIPLATLGRAITGEAGLVKIDFDGECLGSAEVLQRLGFDSLKLKPKEALAVANGTSFSSAIASNAVFESTRLMSVAMASQCMMLSALLVDTNPFEDFVHQCKPHPGQVWTAKVASELLRPSPEVQRNGYASAEKVQVQDRYSMRCLPQYMGSIVETIARVHRTVETEMNAISDNPIIDPKTGEFYQSGNFLGQYIGIAMDDLRRSLGMLAKHLDVQIALLVSPEFSRGLPPSLRGNDQLAYNMGLKGLQISGNSIMPMLTYQGNPLVDHFPTHAEQFNQNINGLSWGAANLAWGSVELFQQYLAIAMIFSVQALDLRARAKLGHFDGRAIVGESLKGVYESVCGELQVVPGPDRPLVFDDVDRWLEQDIEVLAGSLASGGAVVQSTQSILESFEQAFLPSMGQQVEAAKASADGHCHESM